MTVREGASEVRWYLDQIAERLGRIDRFLGNATEQDVANDPVLYDALLRNIQMVGESAARLIANHPLVAANHPDLRLKSLRAMRNFIVHEYVETPVDMLFRTVKITLPSIGYRLKRFEASLPRAGEKMVAAPNMDEVRMG